MAEPERFVCNTCGQPFLTLDLSDHVSCLNAGFTSPDIDFASYVDHLDPDQFNQQFAQQNLQPFSPVMNLPASDEGPDGAHGAKISQGEATEEASGSMVVQDSELDEIMRSFTDEHGDLPPTSFNLPISSREPADLSPASVGPPPAIVAQQLSTPTSRAASPSRNSGAMRSRKTSEHRPPQIQEITIPLRVAMCSDRAHTVDQLQTPEGLVTLVRLTRKNEATRNTMLACYLPLKPAHSARMARIDLIENEVVVSFPHPDIDLTFNDAKEPGVFWAKLDTHIFNSSSKGPNGFWQTQRRKTLFVVYCGSMWGAPIYIVPRGQAI